ncbi:MAG: AAA family ATPase, partial [Candidatus Eisenbacteria bacterium]|nr:AAA family ATPase [Candidatus Eisenbacteria bacterium]
MRRHFLLAIDGPAGTGKTTSARLVAERLGFAYIDSGALYRAIAVAARARGIDSPEDGRL